MNLGNWVIRDKYRGLQVKKIFYFIIKCALHHDFLNDFMYPATMTDTPLWLKNYPSDIDWNAEIPSHPVHKLLENTAKKYPDAPAFDFLGKKY